MRIVAQLVVALALTATLAVASDSVAAAPESGTNGPDANAPPPDIVVPRNTYATLGLNLASLAASSPDHFRLSVIGQSAGGLDIWELGVTDYTDPAWADRPTLVLLAGHHGDSFGDTDAVYEFAASLRWFMLPENPAIFDRVRISIIPVVNPDGWNAAMPTNLRGIDLDRNYPDDQAWNEGELPFMPGYGGTALSEPESRAVVAHVEAIPKLVAAVGVDCCGPDTRFVAPLHDDFDEAMPDENLLSAVHAAWFSDMERASPPGSGTSASWSYREAEAIAFTLVLPEDVRAPTRHGEWDQHGFNDRLWQLVERLEFIGGRLETDPDGMIRNAGMGTAYNVRIGNVTIAETLEPGDAMWGTSLAPYCVGEMTLSYQRLRVSTEPESVPGWLPCIEREPMPFLAPGPALVATTLAVVVLARMRRPPA